ncbi:MAG TPA: hypothetical protein VK902_16475 [Rubrobacter sp.]|jgi:hypothetical protein|nr:hypothetical protein [Rubrobacter sp.]
MRRLLITALHKTTLSFADAEAPQPGYILRGKDTAAEDAPGSGNPSFAFQQAKVLSAYPETSGGFRNPERVAFYRFHRRGR